MSSRLDPSQQQKQMDKSPLRFLYVLFGAFFQSEKHYITFFKKFQVYHTRSLFATTFARQTGCFVEFLFIF